MNLQLAGTCNSSPSVKDRFTKGELMKIYMAIDRELIREAYKINAQFNGLQGGELLEADALLTDFMKLDYSDADINEIANLDYDNLQGLGNIFKKIAAGVKKVASAVVNTVKPVVKAVVNVVKAAAEVVKTVVTLPVRAVVSIGLETLKGPTAKAFTYVFIPDNAPELAANPEVKRKREKQLTAVDRLVSGLSMDREYIMKHIRNAIVTHYSKNPEDVLHDFANQTETEFVWTQDQLNEGEALGIVAEAGTIITAAAGLIGAVAGLAAVFKKPNLPTTADWQQQLLAQRNVTNDPAYVAPKPWYKKPAGIAAIIGGSLALAAGGYYAYENS